MILIITRRCIQIESLGHETSACGQIPTPDRKIVVPRLINALLGQLVQSVSTIAGANAAGGGLATEKARVVGGLREGSGGASVFYFRDGEGGLIVGLGDTNHRLIDHSLELLRFKCCLFDAILGPCFLTIHLTRYSLRKELLF